MAKGKLNPSKKKKNHKKKTERVEKNVVQIESKNVLCAVLSHFSCVQLSATPWCQEAFNRRLPVCCFGSVMNTLSLINS